MKQFKCYNVKCKQNKRQESGYRFPVCTDPMMERLANCSAEKYDDVCMRWQPFREWESAIERVEKECSHEFDADGGPCRHCGKTVTEMMESGE